MKRTRRPLLVASLVLLVAVSVIAGIAYRHSQQTSAGTLTLNARATTAKHFTESLRHFYQRILVDAYIQHGQKSNAWNGDAMKLLEAVAAQLTGQEDALKPTEQAALARAVLRRGCGDPLIRYLYADALCSMGKEDAAMPNLRAAITRFTASDYPMATRRLAPLLLVRCLNHLAPQQSEEIATLRTLCEEWTAAAMHDSSFRVGEQRIALHFIENGHGCYHGSESLLARMHATPGDDTYVTGILQASDVFSTPLLLREGCSSDQLKRASRLLSTAWRLHPEFPEAPTMLITLARQASDIAGSPRVWFERAVAAQCDYSEAYTAMMEALLPANGGSYDRLYAFGEECLRSGRFDTRIPAVFYEVLATISRDSQGARSYWGMQKTREYLATLFAGYAANASPQEQTHYKSMHAATAWHYGQYETAMALLDELGDRTEPEAFSSVFYVDYPRAREEVYSRAAPGGPLIARAEKLRRARGPSVARAEYLRILARGGWSPSLSDLLNGRIAVLGIEEQLRKDKWVPLFPGPGLSGWKVVQGQWRFESDGALAGSTDEGFPLVIGNMRFPARLELLAEIERPAAGATTCLFFGGRDAAIAAGALTGSALGLVVHARQGVALARADRGRWMVITPWAPARHRSMVRMIVWQGTVTAYVDGKRVGSVTGAGQTMASRLLVGISANGLSGGNPARVRFLKIRRLTRDPALPATPRESRAAR